ncbi:MutS-related protein [Paraburkholderia saeva]|uniref:DNA mismatch repair protein MutS n=1 Tax=Paraburkholderia saeva TaxID=2777537 RepID=A0A9N8RRK0_9BURK|nr:DNA mismatch repair protein MutS [Paraburkholderia saeva]CAG4886833.1 DNA mismatch repair protein MutS [Paraburkholderia saeva]
MKAYLLYRDRDFNMHREAEWNEPALVQDLGLNTLYQTMAQGDAFLYDVIKRVVPVSSVILDEITYRQTILNDCIIHETTVRQLYAIAIEAIETERKSYYSFFSASASSVLYGAREMIQQFVDVLKALRAVADSQAGQFQSEGFAQFFSMIQRELTDEYFVTIRLCLKELKFGGGVLISAGLGTGNKGISYVLRKPHEKDPNFLKRLLGKRSPSLTFRIADRDENGARALAELEARGINLVANALAQSADHILSFFTMLRTELAFYLGGVNLHNELTRRGLAVCVPAPRERVERWHAIEGLYDASLGLRSGRAPVGNDVHGDGKELVVITGANQGGKSTFLRAIGLAQIMMQCGMFVTASSFSANMCDGILTHYKREEDASMKSGKLDEELKRMSAIIEHIKEHSLLLCNESFSATNEREGSEIARQIIVALLQKRVKIVFVTHLYALAHGLHEQKTQGMMFLRAERRPDGERTFRLIDAEPLETSYGEDLYQRIFLSQSDEQTHDKSASADLSKVE